MISFLTKECYIFLLYSILIYQSIMINIMRFSCYSVHREPVGGRNCFLGHGVTWGSLNRLLPLPVCSCGISLIHDWHPYLSVRGFSIWIFFTNWWNVNFQTFWKLTFHWMVKKHPLGNKVNKCRKFPLLGFLNTSLRNKQTNKHTIQSKRIDTGRHDICQNFYPTGVFRAKILQKNA